MDISYKLDEMIANLKTQPKTDVKGAYNGNYQPSKEVLELALEIWELREGLR